MANRPYFTSEIERYAAIDDHDLYRATLGCLRNMNRLERTDGPDADLRHVLVPELWRRLHFAGARDELRKISTSLAEYTGAPSIFDRRLKPGARDELRANADRLREQITSMAASDDRALIEQTRFAIAGSRAGDRFTPCAPVYEPAFAYRLVPVIAWRVLRRQGPIEPGISISR